MCMQAGGMPQDGGGGGGGGGGGTSRNELGAAGLFRPRGG